MTLKIKILNLFCFVINDFKFLWFVILVVSVFGFVTRFAIMYEYNGMYRVLCNYIMGKFWDNNFCILFSMTP